MISDKAVKCPKYGSPIFKGVETRNNAKVNLPPVYYDKELKDKRDNIDSICNRDEVYNLAEKCTNTGFGILKDWIENLDEEILFYKLIGYMNKRFDEIKDELS